MSEPAPESGDEAVAPEVSVLVDLTDPVSVPELDVSLWSNSQLMSGAEKIKEQIWLRVEAGNWDQPDGNPDLVYREVEQGVIVEEEPE